MDQHQLTEARARLFEVPYLHPGSMAIKVDGSYSRTGLVDAFTMITTVQLDDTEGFVMMHKSESFVIIVTADTTPEGRHLPVMKLVFKDRHELKFTHNLPGSLLQVNSVSLSEKFQRARIATYVYTQLVERGYAVASDNTQFETAQGLWKSLASLSDYKVLVADVDNGYFRDGGGNVIVYNGNNIPDADIWSTGSDFTGQYRVLILTRK